MYWGDFVDLPTDSTVKCMCFQAVKGITIAHTACRCIPYCYPPKPALPDVFSLFSLVIPAYTESAH